MDASIHWRNGAIPLDEIADFVRNGSSPIQTFIFTAHSVFATTHPSLFSFFSVLPRDVAPEDGATDYRYMKRLKEFGAAFLLVFGTQRARHDVLRWWLLCTLEADCMAPPGATRTCRFQPTGDRWTTYANCHRFDQAALNVLLWHANCYDTHAYYRWSHQEYVDVVGF